jgi:cell division transport system permease protein
MKAWMFHHVRAFRAAVLRLVRAPMSNLLNIGAIAIALALPAGLYTVVANVQRHAAHLSPAPEVSVFLPVDAGRLEVDRIGQRLRQHGAVARVRHVTRDQALDRMKKSTGLSDVLDGLGHNPLPDAFVVDARDASPESLDKLRAEFAAWPGVAHVQLDSAWVRRLDAALRLARLAVAILAGLLALGLLAVTFNTIRLQILTRQDEIEVSKLIGATDGYIRRPFIYYGALLGLGGALGAWGLVWIAVTLLNNGLADLSQLYGVPVRLDYLAVQDAGWLLGGASLLGWVGAWMSVTEHLARIQPR